MFCPRAAIEGCAGGDLRKGIRARGRMRLASAQCLGVDGVEGRGWPKLSGGHQRDRKGVPDICPHHQGHWTCCILLSEELLGLHLEYKNQSQGQSQGAAVCG